MATKQKKNKLPMMALGIAAAIVLFLALGVAAGKLLQKPEARRSYNVSSISSQISEISELATLKYEYRNAAKSTEDPFKLFGVVPVIFTDKSMIVSYKGTIRIGTDLSKAVVEIDETTEPVQIRIGLAPCSIMSNEIDENSWEFWDMKSSVFNPLTPQDDSDLRKEQKAVMEQIVMEDGMLEEANAKAKAQIETFLKMLYPEADVQVTTAEN